MSDQSFRTIVHPSISGRAARITLSNEYGIAPVTFRAASVAIRASDAGIRPGTAVTVTFGGAREVVVAAGASVLSDAVAIDFAFGQDLAVSYHVPSIVPQVTGSGVTAFSKTSYGTAPGAGDRAGDTTGAEFPTVNTFVPFLTRLDADSPATAATVVAFGDSITEGTLSTPDSNTDYPARLADRIQAAGMPVSVVNAGIGGNSVLPCSQLEPLFGRSALDRFARDVLAVPNVRTVIINEGGNDVRFCGRTAVEVQAGLRQLIDAAHAAGLKVFLGTYVPRVSRTVIFADMVPDSFGDDQRQALNAWIRARTDVTVIDFDRALTETSENRQRPETGSPDAIHPGAAGYAMMADIVPLAALIP
ncbi:GDSL-type esterase/lipase family protein [Nocardia sp. NBC_01377]|uniref:GDSL-type esterase/lipase family protein n=1 Tax=Nocardia sp. NBC_01377 TaxID=2903595 RepID=UPI00324A2B9A